MKIAKHGKVLMVVSVMMLMLSGCKNKSEQLVRTWRVADMKYSKQLPPEEQAKTDAALDEMRRSFSITYNADGTYETRVNDQAMNGKWKLNWNSSSLSATQTGGTTIDYKIDELTANSFKFKADDGKDEVTFEMIPAEAAQ